MVIAHHLILTGYGHWLPNDPRGSMSRSLRQERFARVGGIHFGRRKVQPPRSTVREFSRKAETLLTHTLLWFDDAKRHIIAEAFGNVIVCRRYTCWACAILRNHAHLVIRKHRDSAENMIDAFQDASRSRLRGLADIPDQHPIWSRDEYKKYIGDASAAVRTIKYVSDNPAKSGLSMQTWTFVTPYRGEWSGRR